MPAAPVADPPPAALTLRPFDYSDADYAAAVAVHNAAWPDFADTPAQWRFRDNATDPKCKKGRILAVDAAGAVVGYGSYGQPVDMYHPRKFFVDVTALPEREADAALHIALYDAVLAALAPSDPITLRAHARADKAFWRAFLDERGYVEEMREWESRLEVAAFDPAPFRPAADKVAAQGIVIKSLAQLADDPERDRKLFELDWAVTLDMPSPDTLTQPTFEYFRKNVMESPNFLPEAWFVALDGERYVGESALWRRQMDDDLDVGATGVLREYRRRGIATALKLAAVEYAVAAGTPRVRTWNAQINRAMLSINEAMGFEKQPAWITSALNLKGEDAE